MCWYGVQLIGTTQHTHNALLVQLLRISGGYGSGMVHVFNCSIRAIEIGGGSGGGGGGGMNQLSCSIECFGGCYLRKLATKFCDRFESGTHIQPSKMHKQTNK
jgi:hypothetical protein